MGHSMRAFRASLILYSIEEVIFRVEIRREGKALKQDQGKHVKQNRKASEIEQFQCRI
ncbi:uncharacterized protein G2W53_028464 [Senna tora]|uniref:Uncharacterized protein n=1 Tax=Senna tora TaxID=362788 RepID=A0A834T2S1_9FABA|nr:uncharacterized protein G2W53_028464 [Senna tora]